VVGGACSCELQEAGHGEARKQARLYGGLHVGRVFGETDEVADAQDCGANGEDATVDEDVAVVDELASGGNAAGKAEPEDDVVQTAFEQTDEAFDPVGFLEGLGVADEAAELLFAETVVEEELLFFA